MPTPLCLRTYPITAYRVPAPFRAFAVRSEEVQHAWEARAPYGCVQVVRTAFWDDPALAHLVAAGYGRVVLDAFSDVTYAPTTWAELAALAPAVGDWQEHLAHALHATGVLGPALAHYRQGAAGRVDFLASRGAGFHNDVARHWSRCLFWLLALDVADVELVMPHAGVRLCLVPGDLLVFDPALAHGLCRPADDGQAVAASFDEAPAGVPRDQLFLTGELPLTDAQWAALGTPWLPVDAPEHQGALDLLVAEFDERSGHIQRLRRLQGGMSRHTCHADLADDA